MQITLMQVKYLLVPLRNKSYLSSMDFPGFLKNDNYIFTCLEYLHLKKNYSEKSRRYYTTRTCKTTCELHVRVLFLSDFFNSDFFHKNEV